MTAETRVVSSRAALRSAYADLAPGTRRAVVLTMGALHDGHAHLIAAAREHVGRHGHVTVTVFVNPTQFAAGEDLDRYPRSLETDVERCADAGVDLVFAPSVQTVYRDGDTVVTVDPGPLGTLLEGAVRPGHFRGVLTVVHKMLALTGADVTFFGEKDYQQVVLVRRMVRDLDLPVEVVTVATARAFDGLALSSRNGYLSEEERRVAVAVPRSLDLAEQVAHGGGSARDVVSAVQSHLDGTPDLITDYAVVTAPDLGAPPEVGTARLLVAVRLGGIRLLDNTAIELDPRA